MNVTSHARGGGGRIAALLREAGGACGDLGTLLPYVLGVVATGALAPAAVFAGFGATLVATGLLYRMPVAVQPMKVVAAVVLTEGLSAGQIAATGMLLGAALLVLGVTGAVDRIARLLPQSVIAGLQLGLGLGLALFGLSLMAGQWWLGGAALLALILLMPFRSVPAALVMVLGAGMFDAVFGGAAAVTAATASLPWPVLPSGVDLVSAVGLAALPQLPLTLTNAVIVTAALARDLAPDRAVRVTPRRLALSTGAANLLLAPLGALPMCHGAGGLAAQHRFGARTGLAPALLGGALLLLALLPPATAFAVLAHVPAPVLGALLLVTAAELALSPRLFDARPSCRPVILAAGLATVVWNPAVGLAAGIVAEAIRRRLVGDTARTRSV